MSETITFTIDGKTVTVPKGTTVYTAATQLGIDIPIFCYQDRMPPFGACRVCLVEVEKMGKLQTSCTLEATEGMQVKTQSQIAKEGRESILEFLLINHPLDCPICDRGGECPLQDQTLKHGPGESRFYEEKRHFQKPKPLGPVLTLDRERCIQCARCTRFGDIIAKDHALEFIDRGFKTEVGTPDGGPADSKFIGNTILICPVGALTSSVYRFRARPWDNQPTPSTCTLCPVGCSMIFEERDGEIVRTLSAENRQVNDMWLCDKGWFGYEFNSHPERLRQPLVRKGNALQPISWDEAFFLVAEKIKDAKPKGKIAALGGNPLTVEENFLFQKLMRDGAGVSHVDHRVGEPIFTLEEEGIPPGMQISLADCENLSEAWLLGIDLTEEFPLIWLRLSQAINRGATTHFLGHYAPEIAPHLTSVILHAPGKELEFLQKHLVPKNGKGAIFVGRQYLHSPQRLAILEFLLKQKLPLNLLEGRGNSMGARFAGMRPDEGALNARQILDTTAQSGWDLLYVAGANPAKKFAADLWQKARAQLKFLVVQDLFLTETAKQADLVLPALSFVEKEGTFINIEGRLQKLQPGKPLPQGIYSDGEIFVQVAKKLGSSLHLDPSFTEKLKQEKIAFSRPKNLAARKEPTVSENTLKASFAPSLFDQGVRMQHNPHVIKLAKEPRIRIHPNEGAKRNLHQNDQVQVTANGRSIRGKIHLNSGVAEGTVVLPLGFAAIPVQDLDMPLVGSSIELKKVADAI